MSARALHNPVAVPPSKLTARVRLTQMRAEKALSSLPTWLGQRTRWRQLAGIACSCTDCAPTPTRK
jgi:hypothetical protein